MVEDFSGTLMIQKRKKIEASKGFIKICLFPWTANLLWLLNLVAPLTELRLGFE